MCVYVVTLIWRLIVDPNDCAHYLKVCLLYFKIEKVLCISFYSLLITFHFSEKMDFRSLNELPVSMCIMTSSTLYVGTLLALGSYIGFAKLNEFSSFENTFPVLRLVSANGSGWDCSESTYRTIVNHLIVSCMTLMNSYSIRADLAPAAMQWTLQSY